MFCNSCGTQLNDNDIVCPVCGTQRMHVQPPVNNQNNNQQNNWQSMNGQNSYQQPMNNQQNDWQNIPNQPPYRPDMNNNAGNVNYGNMPEKKKSKAPIIITIVVALLLALAAALYFFVFKEDDSKSDSDNSGSGAAVEVYGDPEDTIARLEQAYNFRSYELFISCYSRTVRDQLPDENEVNALFSESYTAELNVMRVEHSSDTSCTLQVDFKVTSTNGTEINTFYVQMTVEEGEWRITGGI